jgi:S-DNA-T family DNA segregation ATPase FtsK/SpoIIIE
MDAHTFGILLVGGAGLAVVVWVLHKIGRALAAIAETLAAAAVIFLAAWWLIKGGFWLVRQLVTRWRTTLAVLALLAWWHWWGWPSLAVTVGLMVSGLVGWRLADLVSFDQWAGRFLRSWWLRWTIYHRKLPAWLHACGLSVTDDMVPVDVTVTLVGRKKVRRDRSRRGVRVPKLRKVRSGPSWDEVRVELVPGQKPEDFDEAARALASARKISRARRGWNSPTGGGSSTGMRSPRKTR